MTSIDAMQRLMAQMRAKIETTTRGTASSTSAAKKSGTVDRQSEQLILPSLQEIAPDAPDRHRRAFRIFLESAIANEFGENLRNDPRFHEIVHSVYETMVGDAELIPLIEQAGAYLLKNAQR